MPDETIVCLTCRNPFVFTEDERKWLLDQVEKGILECFAKPKRCKECRKKKQKFFNDRQKPSAAVPPAKPNGTDKCGCVIPPGAPFPACPHDARGEKGANGEPGLSLPATKLSSVPATEPARVSPPVAVKAPPSSPVKVPQEAPRVSVLPAVPPREEDLRVILLSDDFEKLLCREEIVWKQGSKKVRIILADIGFPVMKAALERAMLKWLKS